MAVAPAVVDAVGGQVNLVVASSPLVLPHLKSGKLKGLAVTHNRRSSSAPDLPTVAESGVAALKGFTVDNWYGIMAPLGTPADIVRKIESEVGRIMGTPEMNKRLSAAGIEASVASGPRLMEALRSDIREFKKVADFANIKPQ